MRSRLTYVRELVSWEDIISSSTLHRPPPAAPFSLSANRLATLWKGDITRLSATTIAFPSTIGLTPRRGSSKAIFKAAGHDLVHQCRQRRPAKLGEAMATGSGDIAARSLIHLPLPYLWSEPIVTSTCLLALTLAATQRWRVVAFASFRGAMYDADADDVARVVVKSVRHWVDQGRRSLDRIVLTAFNRDEYDRMAHWMMVYFPDR